MSQADYLAPDGNAKDDPVPQCDCLCHNTEAGDAAAGFDYEGFPNAASEAWVEEWHKFPRAVDRRDEFHAVQACTKCQPLHALAFSSDPARHTPVPTTQDPPLGGPWHQCQPDCKYCKAYF